jgi:hypothetical protein
MNLFDSLHPTNFKLLRQRKQGADGMNATKELRCK